MTKKRRLGNIDPGEPGSVGTRGRAVWIAPSSGFLSRMTPRTANVVQRVDPNASPIAIAVGPDAIWVADSHATTVTRVDPTGLLTPVGVGHGPSAITLGAGAVWVADSLDDAVVRIDPSIPAATTTIHVGARPSGLAFGGGSVWVANARDGTVSRIDAANGQGHDDPRRRQPPGTHVCERTRVGDGSACSSPSSGHRLRGARSAF